MRTPVLCLLAAAFVASVAAQCPSNPLSPGDHWISVDYDGMSRRYFVHVPPAYVNDGSLGLLYAWHGLGDNPENFARRTRYSDYADEESAYIAVYPEGVGNSFNGGSCCAPASTRNLDDFGFGRFIYDDVASRICFDKEKVFTSGYSNGCFMAQGQICTAPDLFTASGCGSGYVILPNCDEEFEKFNATVSVLEIHGTLDALTPYAGNPVLRFPSVETNLNNNLRRMGCVGEPRQSYSQGRYTCEIWEDCDNGESVEQCTVQRGGHNWYNDEDFNNSEYILRFFGLRNATMTEDRAHLEDGLIANIRV